MKEQPKSREQLIEKLLQQIDLCDFQTKDGMHELKRNKAYLELKENISRVSGEPPKPDPDIKTKADEVFKKRMASLENQKNACEKIRLAITNMEIFESLYEMMVSGEAKTPDYIPVQLCPKCFGDGHLGRYNCPAVMGTSATPICDVCNGSKTIPMVVLTGGSVPTPSDEPTIEMLKEEWYKVYPAHENNADTGEDMFWSSVLFVFKRLRGRLSTQQEKTVN